MAVENDTEEIENFAFRPVGALPTIHHAGNVLAIPNSAEDTAALRFADAIDAQRSLHRHLQEMIDDVEPRVARQIVDRREIEQHRISFGFERFQPRAQRLHFDAFDDGVIDRRAHARRIDRGTRDRR